MKRERPKRNLEICKTCRRLIVSDNPCFGTRYNCLDMCVRACNYGEQEWSRLYIPNDCDYYMEQMLNEWNDEKKA